MKRVIEPGFVWTDAERGHLVACGDATNERFISGLLERTGNKADLALLDPPYGLSSDAAITFRGRSDLRLDEEWDRFGGKEGDPDKLLARLLAALTRAAAEIVTEGNVYIWSSDWWVSHVKRLLRARGLRVWPSYIWAKVNPPPSVRKACLVSACEFLVMASRGQHYFDLSAFPRQRNYFVTAPDETKVPMVCADWVERPVVSKGERVLRADGSYLNPTQKPLDVTECLVRGACPDGGLVLDLCGGTGTATIAADRSGRRAIYVDLDPAHVAATIRRLVEDRRTRGEAVA